MSVLRKLYCWLYLLCGVGCLVVCFGILRCLALHGLPSETLRAGSVLGAAASGMVLFGLAWWSIWKARPFGRICGAIAGLTILLNTLWPGFQFMNYSWVIQGIGLLGVLAFAWRDE